MAFLQNPFALLNDTDGDDTKLLSPVAFEPEKNPGSKHNRQQHKPKSSTAPNKSRAMPIHPHSDRRSQNRRVGMGRGSQRYNASGSDRLDYRQNGDPLNNNGQGNGYRRYNGQADGIKQYGGYRDGYDQNRQGNGFHKVNRQSDAGAQNSDGGCRYYRRSSGSAGYEENGSKQQEWCERGSDRRREVNMINGSRNEGQVLEANQQVKSQGQEKLAEGNSSKGDEHPVRNGGWIFVGGRRGSGGRGNEGWENRFSSRLGGMNWGKGEAPVHKAKESLDGEPRDNDDKSPKTEGEENTGLSNYGEPGQRNDEQVTKRNQSDDLIKEKKFVKKMTLEEYEKQLIEKRKSLEALKKRERKVTLEKDFELMLLVGRKKEDFTSKLNSEKDKLEEEENLEKHETVQSPEQDGKLKKSMSMDIILNVFKTSYPVFEGGGHKKDFNRDGRGRGHRGEHDERGHYGGGYRDRVRGERSGYGRDFERDGCGHGREGRGEHEECRHYSREESRNRVDNGVEAAPNVGKRSGFQPQPLRLNIEDSEHFPGLSAVSKA